MMRPVSNPPVVMLDHGCESAADSDLRTHALTRRAVKDAQVCRPVQQGPICHITPDRFKYRKCQDFHSLLCSSRGRIIRVLSPLPRSAPGLSGGAQDQQDAKTYVSAEQPQAGEDSRIP